MNAAGMMPPLLGSATSEVIAQHFKPFAGRNVFEDVDLHVVDQLGTLFGETDWQVLVALALAVRAPRHGHVCVDLREVTVERLVYDGGDPAADGKTIAALPADRDDWIERVRRSALVGDADTTPSQRAFVLRGSLLYSGRYAGYEARLAQALNNRFAGKPMACDLPLLQKGVDALFAGGDHELNARPKLAVLTAMLRPLAVISGKPGTGKTYAIRRVLALLWAQWVAAHTTSCDELGPRVALVAPTGKAAVRMQESLMMQLDQFLPQARNCLPNEAQESIAKLKAFFETLAPSTIHRLLGKSWENETLFRHNRDNPVPFDTVIVDETSMVDLALMCKLAEAITPDARLIFLGDQHQLASVQAGTVLADICGPRAGELRLSQNYLLELQTAGLFAGDHLIGASSADHDKAGDSIVLLSHSYRFSPESGIGQLAKLFETAGEAGDRNCVPPASDLARIKEVCKGAQISVLPHDRSGAPNDAAIKLMLDGYMPYYDLARGPAPSNSDWSVWHRAILDAFNGFRILCAHRNGLAGISGLNGTMCEKLAKHARRVAGSPCGLFVGCPVLVTRNDYIVGLYNGDVGIVVSCKDGPELVAFPSGSTVKYVAPARLPEHEIAFAMTIHKSQGSEFAHVLMCLPYEGEENRGREERNEGRTNVAPRSRILTRELVYTGITRAKERVTIVGTYWQLADALRRPVERASGLRGRIWA